jgi:hypothetical protein
MTESGKSTLAKRLSADAKKRGIGVIVLDPINDPDWHADFKTENPDEFLEILWKSQNCAVFIDEAGDSVGRYDTAMIQTATKGRHWGHNVHFISQRHAQLSVTVRDQCRYIGLFRCALDDAKIHARQWAEPGLLEAHNLGQGEFLWKGRFSPLTKGNVFHE